MAQPVPILRRVPTRIQLRCNVRRNEQLFWKGSEYQVKQLLANGSVEVVMKGYRMVLRPDQYKVVSRKRITSE